MPCGKIKTNVCVRCKAFALGVYWPISYICDAKLLQKSEMRKDIVIELSYKGFG